MIKKCCVCERIKLEGKWQKGIKTPADKRISHAYCPACFTKTLARINTYHLSFKSKNVPRTELNNVVLGI